MRVQGFRKGGQRPGKPVTILIKLGQHSPMRQRVMGAKCSSASVGVPELANVGFCVILSTLDIPD